MQLTPDQNFDINKLKRLASTPEGKQLASLFMRENSDLSVQQIANCTPQDIAWLKEKAKAFLSSDETKALLKKLEESYER